MMMRPEELVRRGRVMRLVGFGLAAFAFVHQAQAADIGGVLRGAMFELGRPAYTRWGGYYAGGQLGYAHADMDFSRAAASQVAFILREAALEDSGQVSQWDLLGKGNTANAVYGAFAGFNRQWDSAVFGIELNYNHGSLKSSSSGSLRRIVSPGNGFVYDTTISSTASMDITDYGTLRGRGGYVFGNMLAYAFVAVALGSAEVARASTVSAIETPQAGGPGVPFGPITESEARKAFLYGYALGFGLDWMVTPTVFVRGDYEYLNFGRVSDMGAMVSTLRGAVGFKF
jgi:outer membrane immunogenic protein